MGFLERLKSSLKKTRDQVVGGIKKAVKGRFDEKSIEDLEELLITSDMGVAFTQRILDILEDELGRGEKRDPERILGKLREELLKVLEKAEAEFPRFQGNPLVIMVVGVNGVGKTTTIGKLAHFFKKQGKKVLVAASDTFRAAAIEQLEAWVNRAGVDMVRHREGADPSAVSYDALQRAKSKGYDVVIVDTAGRLHTKTPLMEELKKIQRVMKKLIPDAPHETILVLDAVTGQNGLNQAKVFLEAVNVTGIVLAKMDGTAKGGVIVPIVQETNLPIYFLGTGEGIEDLVPFKAKEFVDSLLSLD